MDALAETKTYCEELLKKGCKHVLVGFSGGKDSRCVLDIAVRFFPKVTAFFAFFIPRPKLNCIEERLSILKTHKPFQKIPLFELPESNLLQALKYGRYRFPDDKFESLFDDFPDTDETDIYLIAKGLSGCDCVLIGEKESDHRNRKFSIAAKEPKGIYSPIQQWTKPDVIDYLKGRNIPVPHKDGYSLDVAVGGIGLESKSLIWIEDNYPQDFETMKAFFPLIKCQSLRRKLYPELFAKKKNKLKKTI